MSLPEFTLTVAATADGYIARASDHSPQDWASPEEQDLFFRDVEAADWAVMGRNTHAAADRPDRRRIVLSGSATGEWKRPTQLWLNPAGLSPAELPGKVSHVHPCKSILILGGTRVHDWFLRHGAIDRVHLTVEPVEFGGGLPIFTGQGGQAPDRVMEWAGFEKMTERDLNESGTVYSVWTPRREG